MNAYEVGVKGTDWYRAIEAETRGKAKSRYLREVRESWPDVSFTNIRCRPISRIPDTPTQVAQRQADAFNALYPVGTMLRYWSGVKEGAPTGIAAINHAATVMCGSAVIWMHGVASCHSLSHVEVAA